jgi:hypothetical protein
MPHRDEINGRGRIWASAPWLVAASLHEVTGKTHVGRASQVLAHLVPDERKPRGSEQGAQWVMLPGLVCAKSVWNDYALAQRRGPRLMLTSVHATQGWQYSDEKQQPRGATPRGP